MYSYILQDWTTIESDYQNQRVLQAETDWLSFQPYNDITFWLEVRGINLGGGTGMTMFYDTSPTKDDSLFTAMITNGTTVALGPPIGAAIVTPVISSLVWPTYGIPLGRWVRWRLQGSGDQTANWGANFRILCAANAVSAL